MKVTYYETRHNFKHFSYINCFNPMYDCGDIKCMKSRGFSAKLGSLEKEQNTDARKKIYVGRIGWPNRRRRGGWALLTLGPGQVQR